MLRLRHPVALLLIALVAFAAVMRSYSPPAPVDAGAPDVEFSALRAEAILRELITENAPHVAGSAANAGVRDRILEQLAAYGYEPKLQSLRHCHPGFGSCSPVDNIIAAKRGSTGRHAVLITAHYDSGWAGAGAADNGAGVAALLEIARMSADFPPFANDVIFLFSDAEEQGLVGAHAFAERHPAFERVKAVINLEARGVSGPSAMFESSPGDRSVIRMFSKGVDRPVGNSLVYEMYRRMPNDTDYSVYRERGVMGVNFAFAQGAALYHSARDDIDHLDLGSLQHHGDNAWGMLKALGERDLSTIYHREDAGYMDLAGTRLAHYPVSIAGGLALFLGVWVMIAIGLAFRKEFRYRQLRWGLLAIPLLLALIVAGAWLLSWPLGRWPDLHPLEHPYPAAGRTALFLSTLLAVYAALKVFTGRVSACAWMILGWALVFALGLVLSSRLPTVTHIALLPLAAFALGSVIDLFRKKSPAPLLFASVAGFAASSYVSLYHFFMLDVVMNFDRAAIKVVPLWLMVLTAMPMLLAFVRRLELSWRPARWLLSAMAIACLAHLFLPAYTAERPRDMSVVYVEPAGESVGYIVVESVAGTPDARYARSHDFVRREMDDGRLGRVERWVREIDALGLPEVTVVPGVEVREGAGWRRAYRLEWTGEPPLVQVTLPLDGGVTKAWVDGVLALDSGLETKRERRSMRLRLVNPGAGPVTLELATEHGSAIAAAVMSWRPMPPLLAAPFTGNWPDDAAPAFLGPRAEKHQAIELPAVSIADR